jgi:hypothetical protein
MCRAAVRPWCTTVSWRAGCGGRRGHLTNGRRPPVASAAPRRRRHGPRVPAPVPLPLTRSGPPREPELLARVPRAVVKRVLKNG